MEASVSLRVGPSASEHLGHVSDAEVVEVVKRMSLLELVVDEMKDGKVFKALKDANPRLTEMMVVSMCVGGFPLSESISKNLRSY